MFSFLVLITVLRISPCLGLLFPISDTIHWSPLDPKEIDCLHNTRTPPASSYFAIPGYLPILKQQYEVSGFLCNSLTLSTKCSKGFFGGEDITYIEEHHKLTEQECVRGVMEYLKDQEKVVTYPPPACSWYRTSTESRSFIVVRPRNLVYDPYGNVVVSELFPGGQCSRPYCPTIYEYEGWLPDQHKKPECLPDHLDTSLFYIKPHTDALVDIWSPDLNIPSGHKICTMDYCGVEGIKFHDGSWIGLKRESIPRGKEKLNNFFVNLPSCPDGDHLNLLEKYHTEHIAARTRIEEFFQAECKKTKMALMIEAPISRVSLQSLTPTTPGRHRVYRYNNGSIEMGVSDYKDVTIIPPISGNPAMIKTINNVTMRWKYWIHDERHNIYDGPNGLFLYNGSVMSYTDDLDNYNDALALSMRIQVPIIKPTLYHDHPLIEASNGTYSYLHSKDASLGEVIQEGVTSMGQSALRLLFTIGVVFALGGAVILAISKLYLHFETRASNQHSLPLVYYKP